MLVAMSKAGRDWEESLRERTEDRLMDPHLSGLGCSHLQGWEYEAYSPLEGNSNRTPTPLFIEHKHNTASG
jgi:hypothetical protein